MAKLLYIGTQGTDDPTVATFTYLNAKGAVDAGHEAGIMLMGEATHVIRAGMAGEIHGVGIPPLKELLDFAVSNEVPIYV